MEAFTFNTVELILLSAAGILLSFSLFTISVCTTGYTYVTEQCAKRKFTSHGIAATFRHHLCAQRS